MHKAEIELTTQLVANYVSRNNVPAGDLPTLIETIHRTLHGLREPAVEAPAERPTPAVSVKRSVTPDYIISLFDGRKLKAMKRYLATKHGMTPDEYRAYWGLPRDYPMVAANYSAARSELAKSAGLGNKAGTARQTRAQP